MIVNDALQAFTKRELLCGNGDGTWCARLSTQLQLGFDRGLPFWDYCTLGFPLNHPVITCDEDLIAFAEVLFMGYEEDEDMVWT